MCSSDLELKAVVNEQIDVLYSFELGTSRELLGSLPVINSHALVVSGIRRCGKSVLLHQFIRNEIDEVFYFNFADIRLYEFSASDFVLLDEIIRESGKKILFFDEIQIELMLFIGASGGKPKIYGTFLMEILSAISFISSTMIILQFRFVMK